VERYKVATVVGDLVPLEGGTSRAAGFSAHVLDTAYCHNVVGTFRSETRIPQRQNDGTHLGSRTQGQEDALVAAESLAALLNAAEAREE
jgi:hypothetical protein